jgi:hypothetical protein
MKISFLFVLLFSVFCFASIFVAMGQFVGAQAVYALLGVACGGLSAFLWKVEKRLNELERKDSENKGVIKGVVP